MVKSVLAFGQSGLSDWLWQRISSVVLAAYVVFLFVYFLLNPELNFQQWQALFSSTWMRIFTLLTLISLVIHAWIGIWTVLTDYIKPLGLRLFFQAFIVIALVAYLAWGIQILWSL